LAAELRAPFVELTLEKAAYAAHASCVRRAAWHVPDNVVLICSVPRVMQPEHFLWIPNVEHATCPVRQHTSAAHESWCAQRRYAASIGALMAQNLNLSTENSKLAADNLALTAQCNVGVNAAATSDASLPDGTRWQCTHTRARAHALAPMLTRPHGQTGAHL
jgi:hypothetical protein